MPSLTRRSLGRAQGDVLVSLVPINHLSLAMVISNMRRETCCNDGAHKNSGSDCARVQHGMGWTRGGVGIDLSSACTADWRYYAVESEADTEVDMARAMEGAVLYLFKICYRFFAC